ncbi:hypothetical protein CK203_017540 [Vitis vinifera]|uniref:Uncharacterized protein n=1 Tax=Vitis vinifera TaxID=29760 RepID=A0A438IXU1_VITVI|nr:hypothetical protein CK203_017540 [Vitis vinifera]
MMYFRNFLVCFKTLCFAEEQTSSALHPPLNPKENPIEQGLREMMARNPNRLISAGAGSREGSVLRQRRRSRRRWRCRRRAEV